MRKVDKATYKRILKNNKFLVKRTKNGYYVLGAKKFLKATPDPRNNYRKRR